MDNPWYGTARIIYGGCCAPCFTPQSVHNILLSTTSQNLLNSPENAALYNPNLIHTRNSVVIWYKPPGSFYTFLTYFTQKSNYLSHDEHATLPATNGTCSHLFLSACLLFLYSLIHTLNWIWIALNWILFFIQLIPKSTKLLDIERQERILI